MVEKKKDAPCVFQTGPWIMTGIVQYLLWIGEKLPVWTYYSQYLLTIGIHRFSYKNFLITQSVFKKDINKWWPDWHFDEIFLFFITPNEPLTPCKKLNSLYLNKYVYWKNNRVNQFSKGTLMNDDLIDILMKFFYFSSHLMNL